MDLRITTLNYITFIESIDFINNLNCNYKADAYKTSHRDFNEMQVVGLYICCNEGKVEIIKKIHYNNHVLDEEALTVVTLDQLKNICLIYKD